MYVLFVTMGYPTLRYVGHGIFEFDQAKALTNLGCKVIYASIDVRSIRRWRKWGYERKNIDGIDIYGINIPLGRVPQKLRDKVSILALNYLYNKIIKEQGKPDILHAHFTDLGYISTVLKEKTSIPLIVTEHSSLINKDNIEKNLYKKAFETYKKANVLITVSSALSERIEKNFNVKSVCIPNVVDTEIFNYSRKLTHEKFNFISTGNLIYLKRMDLTIDAFNKAFSGNKDVTLTIFGEGPEKNKLQELINEYRLKDRVFLKGMCQRSMIADQFKSSDCFVLASQTETFGVAYIEALATGVPVIATKCGGPEGFINKNNGIMIEVDDVAGLVDAMKYMYKNIKNYNRSQISQTTRALFSPKSVGNRLVEVYKDILY